MKIMLNGTPAAMLDSLSSILRGSGVDVEYCKNKIPDNHYPILLVYSRAEYAVEEAIRAKTELSAAIDNWIRDVKLVLDLFHSNRDHVFLIHGPTAVSSIMEFSIFCNNNLGFEVSKTATLQSKPKLNKNAIEQIIASQVVATIPELNDLNGELEASSVLLRNLPPEYIPDYKIGIYEYQKMVSDLDKLNERLSSQEGQMDEFNIEKKNLMTEVEYLKMQLHQAHEEVKAHHMEAKSLREEGVKSSNKEISEIAAYTIDLEKLIMKLLNSRTWKTMAPVREFIRISKSILRGKRVSRNRLPMRPAILENLEKQGHRTGFNKGRV